MTHPLVTSSLQLKLSAILKPQSSIEIDERHKNFIMSRPGLEKRAEWQQLHKQNTAF
jgi:hypothetical protein